MPPVAIPAPAAAGHAGADSPASAPRLAGPPAPPVQPVLVLRDGRRLLVRPLRPADEPAYRRFVASLSSRSQYYRFFSPKPGLTDREIEHFVRVDHVDRGALVAVDGDEIVGLARYDRSRSDPSSAEVAFVVRDDAQGLGIGPRLLRLLAGAAYTHGVRRLTATVLPDNRRMLRVFAISGWLAARRLEDGAIAVTLDIDRTEVRAISRALRGTL